MRSIFFPCFLPGRERGYGVGKFLILYEGEPESDTSCLLLKSSCFVSLQSSKGRGGLYVWEQRQYNLTKGSKARRR